MAHGGTRETLKVLSYNHNKRREIVDRPSDQHTHMPGTMDIIYVNNMLNVMELPGTSLRLSLSLAAVVSVHLDVDGNSYLTAINLCKTFCRHLFVFFFLPFVLPLTVFGDVSATACFALSFCLDARSNRMGTDRQRKKKLNLK